VPRDRKRAAHRAQGPVEPELSDSNDVRDRLRAKLTRRDEERERHGQVERRAFLAHVCRRKVDGNAPRRKHEPRVGQRRGNTLAALLHRAGGEPDDRELREPLGDVDLDGDIVGIDAEDRGGSHGGEHGGKKARRRRSPASIDGGAHRHDLRESMLRRDARAGRATPSSPALVKKNAGARR
jgi:hypothetical protein